MGARKWWRDHFTDHPLYKQKADAAYPNPSRKDKVKCICTKCMTYFVAEAMQSDELEVTTGSRSVVRTVQDIELDMFSNEHRKWIASRTTTLLSHLRDCLFQSPDIKSKAVDELNKGKNEYEFQDTPRAQRTIRYNPPLAPHPVTPPTWNSSAPSPFDAPPPDPLYAPQPQYPGSNQHLYYANPMEATPFPSFPSLSQQTSESFDSPTSSQVIFQDFPRTTGKRSRVGSYTGSVHTLSSRNSHGDLTRSPGIPFDVYWSDERQALFEDKIVKLTASADLSFSWVENPEWLAFMDEFLPHTKCPSRKVLSQRILPNTLKSFRSDAMKRASGLQVTVQYDGWTGENHHHFVAFMMTGGGQVFTIKLNDTTTERKTADNMLTQMLEIINILKTDWKVDVTAFTSDASGESRKARKLLVNQFPHLVVPDCYAHQINLIVGDYFKAKADFLLHSSRANDVIAWLRSKSAILGLIRATLVQSGKKEKSVIRPVPTRWTAFYLAYRRLLELREALEVVITSDAIKQPEDRIVVQGDAKAKAKATAMVGILKDPAFWHGIVRIQHHLAPLAIAANVTQGTFCRLNDVLLTFGSLLSAFTHFDHPDDLVIKEIKPFKLVPQLFARASIYSLMERLWQRFYGEECPPALYLELCSYLDGTDEFRDLGRLCAILKVTAEGKNESPDPTRVYRDITIPGAPKTPLIRLANHLLSICPNSASCERLFSTFGLILTKLRSRLGTSKLLDLAELKMHLRDAHIHNGSKRTVQKRAFGIRNTQDAVDPTAVPPPEPGDLVPRDLENSEDPNVAPPNLNSTTESLTAITAHLRDMVALDGNDNQGPATPSNSPLSVKLSDLFDLKCAHWINFQSRSAVGSLEEEMKIYKLLDLDAPGEDHLGFDLDESTETILTI